MPVTQRIENTSYRKIVPQEAEDRVYAISPFDVNGNLISKMTIEVDTTIADCELYLPLLSEWIPDGSSIVSAYPQTNFEIIIINIGNTGQPVILSILENTNTYFSGQNDPNYSHIFFAGQFQSVMVKPIGANNSNGNLYEVLLNINLQ
jgi:hypothetical protein